MKEKSQRYMLIMLSMLLYLLFHSFDNEVKNRSGKEETIKFEEKFY